MSDTNIHLLPKVWPHEKLKEAWESGAQSEDGATQPWIQALLYQLCRALDIRVAVELGTWKGYTSAWLACAIAHNGGGSLGLVDSQEATLQRAVARVEALGLSNVTLAPLVDTSKQAIEVMPKSVQFVFLDDDKLHTADRLAAIKARVPGCYVAQHDAEIPEVGAAVVAAGGIILDIPPGDGNGSLGLVRL